MQKKIIINSVGYHTTSVIPTSGIVTDPCSDEPHIDESELGKSSSAAAAE